MDHEHSAVIIDVDDLATRMASSGPPVILDVRWELGDDRGHDHHREGHIPGAVYVDLDTELAGPADPRAGRHPLRTSMRCRTRRVGGASIPTAPSSLRRQRQQSAARAWWLLRWAGLRDVRLLDGGLRAWMEAGHDLRTGDETP